MTDIDSMLSRLRELPTDPRLAKIDAAVLDGLERKLAAQASPSGMLYTGAAALALFAGIIGAALPGAPTTAASTFPFGAPAALAPSTLLASAR